MFSKFQATGLKSHVLKYHSLVSSTNKSITLLRFFVHFFIIGVKSSLYLSFFLQERKNKILHKINESKRYIIKTYLNSVEQFNAFL